MSFDLNIHGVQLHIECESLETSTVLKQAMGSYVSSSPRSDDLRITIREASPDTRTKISSVSRQLTWIRNRPMWGEIANDILNVTDGVSLVRVHYCDRTVELFLHLDTFNDRPFFLRTFFYLPIIELLRLHDLYYVHGAFVQKGERGVLILGKGESGKSTLALKLMTEGWKLLADDNLFLRSNSAGGCSVVPFEQTFALRAEIRDQLQIDVPFLEERGKLRMCLRDLPSDRIASSGTPSHILLLRDRRTAASASPSPRSRAFQVLLEENPLLWTYAPLADRHARSLREVVATCRCFDFHPPEFPSRQFDNLSLQTL